MSERSPRWQPIAAAAPPPSPKILNLPRQTRRKQPKITTKNRNYYYSIRGKLDALFDQERPFSTSFVPVVLLNSRDKRERVEKHEVKEEDSQSGGAVGGCGFVEEKWKFQAEILRSECNFLRTEREFALRKLERNRLQMERTLKSAVNSLVSGRNKINEGKNVSLVLEEKIEDLAEMLEELQRSSTTEDFEVCGCSNFDKKASLLQRQLMKLGGLSDEKCPKEICQMTKTSFSFRNYLEMDNQIFISDCKSNNNFGDVDLQDKQIEGMSRGNLNTVELEYVPTLSTAANSSVGSSVSEFPDSSSFSTRKQEQDPVSQEDNKCSGRCKAIVRRIVEQVRSETRQWSQMQDMLAQVRSEMEELQTSRNFWEGQALAFDKKIQSLQSAVQKWRQKAVSFETKANEMQIEVFSLKGELEKLRSEKHTQENKEVLVARYLPLVSLGAQIEKEKHKIVCRLKENYHANDNNSEHEIISEKTRIQDKKQMVTNKYLPPTSLGKQLEKEKRLLICRSKEYYQTNDTGSNRYIYSHGRRNGHSCSDGFMTMTRSPFNDIGNSTPMRRQRSKVVSLSRALTLEPSQMEKSLQGV